MPIYNVKIFPNSQIWNLGTKFRTIKTTLNYTPRQKQEHTLARGIKAASIGHEPARPARQAFLHPEGELPQQRALHQGRLVAILENYLRCAGCPHQVRSVGLPVFVASQVIGGGDRLIYSEGRELVVLLTLDNAFPGNGKHEE